MTRLRWTLLGMSCFFVHGDNRDDFPVAYGAEPAVQRPIIRQITAFQPPRVRQLPGFLRTKPQTPEFWRIRLQESVTALSEGVLR